ncbi:Alpha/Beta hydrolase protein [Leptodontidium sp. 2 PMI_412]|nr:lipase [Leptodontidium sp. MPI-SDFR-AT-0119]KAH9208479.1 Alpha/Beta hydrolase protein [Leptodontidium sp. 2 PMI_412]
MSTTATRIQHEAAAFPALDPGLEALLSTFEFNAPENFEALQAERERLSKSSANNIPSDLDGILHKEHVIQGPLGDIKLSVFSRESSSATSTTNPGVFFIHPGGMCVGSRFLSCDVALDWVRDIGAVCVTAEYRLAPEFPDPAPIEDCYAALKWMVQNATALYFNSSSLIVAGGSAGGGLAAGLTLLCRDRKDISVTAQVLVCPMLDPDNKTPSTFQRVLPGMWSRNANRYGWDCLLGEGRYKQDVSIYAAPSRAKDVTGLPPTFIDVGECEIFRDECVAYASKLWTSGVSTELHVWPGAFHGFDMVVPNTSLSVIARRTRNEWVNRWFQNLHKVKCN